MKHKLWLFQLPLIITLSALFLIVEKGELGELQGKWGGDMIRKEVFPSLRVFSGWFTDKKFTWFRGREQPKNNVVVVAVDDYAIESIGRWPWHRDAIAYLIEKTFEAGAKVVGLDMVFSEPDPRVPESLSELLRARGEGHLVDAEETDAHLAHVIEKYKDRLVLGWASDGKCQPAYANLEDCPVTDPEFREGLAPDRHHLAIKNINYEKGFNPQNTPVLSSYRILPNIEPFRAAAGHIGSFDVNMDDDGVIRRIALFKFVDGQAYPTLGLEMAKIGLQDDIQIDIDAEMKVKSLKFAKSGKEIDVTPQGAMNINFRGGRQSFPYIGAIDVMGEEIEVEALIDRKIASVNKFELLQDAYVVIGVTALAVYDLRTFPFESNVAGVEGHTTILDNILAGDYLRSTSTENGTLWILFVMILGAILFAYAIERLESLPAIGLFIVTFAVFIFIDVEMLFANNINWNTSFLYSEFAMIFLLTLGAKYWAEEKEKKFVQSAFGRYISPDLVDTIVKDPSKLSLGGEKKDLTILFSDIRSFTTLSEKMDAKQLAAFLNDYLGTMTDIIVNDFNGTLDKYIGDAIMAFWGAPLDQKHHATNGLKAAIKMQQELANMQEMFKKNYGIDVAVGVGLNTGAVNVGNMGSEKNFNYTVIGDHVNLASRLEGLTKPYGCSIITSEFTIADIKENEGELPDHRSLDLVKVKGKNKAVELVEIFDREISKEGLEIFEAARKHYLSQEWDAAVEKFKVSNQLLRPTPDTDDGPSGMYIERCGMFKESPPGADWDGTWTMKTK